MTTAEIVTKPATALETAFAVAQDHVDAAGAAADKARGACLRAGLTAWKMMEGPPEDEALLALYDAYHAARREHQGAIAERNHAREALWAAEGEVEDDG